MNCENEEVFKGKGFPGELTRLNFEELYNGGTSNQMVKG